MPTRQSVSLAAVVFILGFLLTAATLSTRARRAEEAPRRAQLVSLIESRQSLVRDLDQAVEQLRGQVVAARDVAARRSSSARRANDLAGELALQAGTVAVTGPGIVVTLDNSTRTPPSPDEAGAYVIHDADVQLVVNALFAAGAEAIAVNDSRVVATTPIRSAGATVVVNFRPLTPPYRVVAIGADREAFEDSPIARRFRQWTRLFGLGYDIEAGDRLDVPSFTGRVAISTAVPTGTR